MHDSNAPAWAWVLSHASIIRGIAFKHAIGAGLTPDDFHSALLLRCVEKWSSYNAEKGAPSTWIWNQARATKSLMIDHEKRNRHMEVVDEVSSDMGASSKSLIASVEAGLAKKKATDDEWSAVCVRAAGLSEEETRNALGVAPFSARRRVARLAKRLEG